jgi:lipoic acid synthetase
MYSMSKPEWLAPKPSAPHDYIENTAAALKDFSLHTVCEEALCPNRGECWKAGTATFMLLGAVCTRNCRFCAVRTGKAGEPLDAGEAERIALCAAKMGLRYVVLTSVDRDDLPDKGAAAFAAAVVSLKRRIAGVKVEILTPDYSADEFALLRDAALSTAARSAALLPGQSMLPEVIAHNVETVPRLQSLRDGRASFDRSLATLRAAFALAATYGAATKSSILLGLGEKPPEVLDTMAALRDAGVSILVLGQYLQPSPKQVPVKEYITSEQFSFYKEEALRLGFKAVSAETYARTSYRALELAG